MKESFDLDQALERMKRETPEVPADFHARWMDAVRGEAEASAPPAAGEKKGVAQWRRILSMVAIAIFLVGGTLLTRGRLNAMILKKNGEPVRWKTAEEPKTDPEKEEAESDAGESAPAANEAMAYNQAAQSAAMNEAGESAGGAAGYDAAVYDAAMYSEAAYDAPAYEGVVSGEANLTMAGGAAPTEARRSALMTSAAVTEEAAEMDEAPEMEEAAEMDEAPEMAVAATNAPAAKAPAAVAAGGVRTTEAPVVAEEKAAKTVGILATDADAPSSFWEQAGAFFVDMGRFILYALPVILGAAALAVVFALIDRRRRKRKTDRSE